MTYEGMSPHISKQYDKDLEQVMTEAMSMGGMVEEQLIKAIRALMESDIELAQEVIDHESVINKFEMSVDKVCTQILARRQPTASDLRLIIAIGKTITDLERIGDEAEKIAKMAIKLAEKQGAKSYYIGINAMGTLARVMVHDALDAFARMDSAAAVKVAKQEPESDDQYTAILRQLITYMMEDPRSITAAIDAVWCARALERIADHARNVCEHIIYFVEGMDVRHISVEEMEERIKSDKG